MHKKCSLTEEGFLLAHGSEGVPAMVGRQLEWVNLWLRTLPVVAHHMGMTRKQRSEVVTLKGFLQRLPYPTTPPALKVPESPMQHCHLESSAQTQEAVGTVPH